ncbi:MAG: hypothetical protein U0936_25415 [Planctomycetaceae bacterium]
MIANRQIRNWLLILVFASSLSGCATIISGRKSQVTVKNHAGPTYFNVVDQNGHVVHSGVTPAQVTLKTSEKAFRPAKYAVVYAGQEGVYRQEVTRDINWWTAGNIVIGGLPGVIVDAGTGALWTFESDVYGNVPAHLLVADRGQGEAIIAGNSVPASGSMMTAEQYPPQPQIQQASFGEPTKSPFHQRNQPMTHGHLEPENRRE